MISYTPLWETMKKKSITKYYLIRYCQVSSGQLSRLKQNRYVSTHTIDMLCSLLSCRVEDIMEYHPDLHSVTPPPPVRPKRGRKKKSA